MIGLSEILLEKEKTIADLQAQIRRYELSEQKMRSIQHKLDTQIGIFSVIHTYTQQAFHAIHPYKLNSIIAEGIADIFQLEIGAVLVLDPTEDKFTLAGSFNIDTPELAVPFSKEWLQKQGLQGQIKHNILLESPVTENSPWTVLNLAHAVYVPIIGNDRTCEGIILGGVGKSGENVYEFQPKEMLSSFIVYCQQMNGIYNSLSALAKANEAGKAKTDFLANMSHEMRTPLNAVMGMIQINKNNNQADDLRKAMEQIEISSKHLLGLINDILDISKIEEGKLMLANEPFNLKTVVDNLFKSLKQSAENKRQHLSVNCEELSSYRVIGDAMRLSQVLINLLSNAIKFTPEDGRIDVNIEAIERNSEKILLKFSVLDTGIGLSPEFLMRIFSPFEQADSSISRKFGGTGLGLAISQRIVELMGGRLQVESQENKGSNFYFSAWFQINKEEEVVVVDENAYQSSGVPDFSGKIVLVVDDIEINREIIFSMLDHTGIFIESAQNGEEALNLVEKSTEGYYDLILMDIQMPVMDGYTSTKRIRSLSRADVKNIVILALTANAFKEDVEQALSAGMNGHVSKPVEESILLSTIVNEFQKQVKHSATN